MVFWIVIKINLNFMILKSPKRIYTYAFNICYTTLHPSQPLHLSHLLHSLCNIYYVKHRTLCQFKIAAKGRCLLQLFAQIIAHM